MWYLPMSYLPLSCYIITQSTSKIRPLKLSSCLVAEWFTCSRIIGVDQLKLPNEVFIAQICILTFVKHQWSTVVMGEDPV